jgi:hypothetical protein
VGLTGVRKFRAGTLAESSVVLKIHLANVYFLVETTNRKLARAKDLEVD